MSDDCERRLRATIVSDYIMSDDCEQRLKATIVATIVSDDGEQRL